MSSSEYFRRAAFVDLQQDVPGPSPQDFSEQTEFPRLARTAQIELTPDEAHRDGLTEGEARGRAATLKELEPVLAELRSVTQSMIAVRQERLDAVESDLVQLATELAKRILRGELAQGEDAVLQMARACIEEAKGESPLILRVAPGDIEILRAHLPELELDLADTSVQLRADALLEPGSIVLETALRCYDGRPERLLRQAEQRLGTEGDS